MADMVQNGTIKAELANGLVVYDGEAKQTRELVRAREFLQRQMSSGFVEGSKAFKEFMKLRVVQMRYEKGADLHNDWFAGWAEELKDASERPQGIGEKSLEDVECSDDIEEESDGESSKDETMGSVQFTVLTQEKALLKAQKGMRFTLQMHFLLQ